MMLHSKKRVTLNLRFPLKTFLLFLLLICFNLYWIPWIVRKFHIHDESKRPSVPFPATLLDHSRQLHLEVPSSDLPVYYINRDADFIRRDFIRQQLRSWGFKDINRVSAWNTEDVQKYVKSEVTSIPNIMSQNEKEIACIASHLHAMLLAVEDTSNTSPYALIMEDDVSLEMQVDWLEMIEHAPKDFTILQLTTSNSEAVTKLWSEYVHALNIDAIRAPLNGSSLRGSLREQAPILESELSPNPNHQWVLRKWDSAYWSTQAYLIHKATY